VTVILVGGNFFLQVLVFLEVRPSNERLLPGPCLAESLVLQGTHALLGVRVAGDSAIQHVLVLVLLEVGQSNHRLLSWSMPC